MKRIASRSPGTGVDLFDDSLILLIRYLRRFARYGHDPITIVVTTGGGALTE